jgi:hypothetical protein
MGRGPGLGLRIGEGFPPVNLSCKRLKIMWNGEIIFTLAAFAGGLGLVSWMFRLEKHPRQDLQPRLVPTTLIMLLGGLLALGAGVHLLGLAGIHLPAKTP